MSRIRLNITISSLLLSLIAGTALAENSVIINQVGAGSVDIQQSGKDNSAEIHQNLKDPSPLSPEPAGDPMPPPLGAPSTVDDNDYQKKILENPYTSPQARAEALGTDNDSTVQDPKRTEANTKRVLADEKKAANRIRIHQEGQNNKTTTSQQGKKNDLFIEQAGDKNSANRKQIGDDNHSQIIQNGVIVEDK